MQYQNRIGSLILLLGRAGDSLVEENTSADNQDDEADGQRAYASRAHLLDCCAHLRDSMGTSFVKLSEGHACCTEKINASVSLVGVVSQLKMILLLPLRALSLSHVQI